MESFQIGCPSTRFHCGPESKPKHTNVAFLKTHKTASTTMQNLLFRFAERHNLTVALPVQGCGHQFCYPQSFTTRFVDPHTVPPNIIASHMRFNKAELQRLMPENTIYITILREPGSMFESLFSYYNQYCPSFRRVPNGLLEAFLDDPWHFYRPSEKDSMYAHNTLTHDLGGKKDHPSTDLAYAQAFIEEMEKDFSLVMITEHFDESLILLRHLLSWDLEDIVYLKHNMRTSNSKQSLTPSLIAKIRNWNFLDAILYDYFNASLWRQLSALGPGLLANELRLLEQEQGRLVKSCFSGQSPIFRSGEEIQNKDLRPFKPNKNVDIVGYEIPENVATGLSRQAQELCLKLIMPEVQYSNALLRSESLRHRRNMQFRSMHAAQQSLRTAAQHVQVQRSQQPAADLGPASETGIASNTNSASETQSQSVKAGTRSSQTQ